MLSWLLLRCNSYALAAYAGTGKDTFFQDARGRRLQLSTSGQDVPPGRAVRWEVYAPRGGSVWDLQQLTRKEQSDEVVERFAFADALKTETHAWLGFRDCPVHAFEQVKESLVARSPETGEAGTIRHWYIEHGQRRRREDPDIWAKIVATQVADRRAALAQTGRALVDITTDWRFGNELKVRPELVTTIRLFRAEVPIAPRRPDPATDSEHNLDNAVTDFLLVPPGQFGAAAAAFPQYEQYRLAGRLHFESARRDNKL